MGVAYTAGFFIWHDPFGSDAGMSIDQIAPAFAGMFGAAVSVMIHTFFVAPKADLTVFEVHEDATAEMASETRAPIMDELDRVFGELNTKLVRYQVELNSLVNSMGSCTTQLTKNMEALGPAVAEVRNEVSRVGVQLKTDLKHAGEEFMNALNASEFEAQLRSVGLQVANLDNAMNYCASALNSSGASISDMTKRILSASFVDDLGKLNVKLIGVAATLARVVESIEGIATATSNAATGATGESGSVVRLIVALKATGDQVRQQLDGVMKLLETTATVMNGRVKEVHGDYEQLAESVDQAKSELARMIPALKAESEIQTFYDAAGALAHRFANVENTMRRIPGTFDQVKVFQGAVASLKGECDRVCEKIDSLLASKMAPSSDGATLSKLAAQAADDGTDRGG